MNTLTGIQYLNFIADIFKIDKSKRQNLIQKYSRIFEIEQDLGNIISSYSHGIKPKLAIISAIIHSHKVLILDKTFVGLDPKAWFTLVKELHWKGLC